MKELLDSYMDDIEYTLLPNNNFYIDEKGEHIKTCCVKLQVDSAKANAACDHLASAWMDPEFFKELANHSIRKTIEFIPYVKKGMMMTKVFCTTMKQQHEFNENTIAISVASISRLKVEVICHGKMTSLVNMIHKLRDSNGSAIFSGMEPMKFMAEQGQFPHFDAETDH